MLSAPTAALAARLARVCQATEAAGLDAFVVSHLPNLAYLSNFDGSAGLGLIAAGRLYLLTDFRYAAAVHDLLASTCTPPGTTFVQVEGSYEEALAAVMDGIGARVAGLETASLPWNRAEWWRVRFGRRHGASR